MSLRQAALALAAAGRLCAFEAALPGYEFEFPRDHFEHRGFEVEWWYYTGNLRDAAGRPFGFELTFFRVATGAEPAESSWDAEQVYLAHFAVSDVAAGRFHRAERLNRAGPGLAGASLAERAIWNGNWSATWRFDASVPPEQRLQAVTEEARLDLRLRPAKPHVVHGRDGVSRKAEGPGKASHYISFTRLLASGRLVLGSTAFDVEGTAWMDHEFSTDSLGPGQVGWDWFSIQLSDGTDLMLYGMRGADGRHGRFSSGTFIDSDGRSRHLTSGDFSLRPGRAWRSGATGARYPVEWAIEIPPLDCRLAARSLLDDQEMVSERDAAPTYWEGAARFDGACGGAPVEGVGYIEMTGYHKPVWLGRNSGAE